MKSIVILAQNNVNYFFRPCDSTTKQFYALSILCNRPSFMFSQFHILPHEDEGYIVHVDSSFVYAHGKRRFENSQS
jgi:hypothetical protein